MCRSLARAGGIFTGVTPSPPCAIRARSCAKQGTILVILGQQRQHKSPVQDHYFPRSADGDTALTSVRDAEVAGSNPAFPTHAPPSRLTHAFPTHELPAQGHLLATYPVRLDRRSDEYRVTKTCFHRATAQGQIAIQPSGAIGAVQLGHRDGSRPEDHHPQLFGSTRRCLSRRWSVSERRGSATTTFPRRASAVRK